jgi:DNA-directed RNA polymerase subunit RPC12/RpoP
MGTTVEGFSFSEFCLKCQKIMEHRVEVERKDFFGVCSSCGQRRLMTGVNQVYYPKTELWVTRFKIGNLASVVTGKLLDAAKHVLEL